MFAASVVRSVIAVGFLGFGCVHFLAKPKKVMAKMIPPAIVSALGGNAPFLVEFTGVCEILGGLGILLPQTRYIAGGLLAVFCVCVFPANWYAAKNPETFGPYAIPLQKRLPAQVVLIALILWSCCTAAAF